VTIKRPAARELPVFLKLRSGCGLHVDAVGDGAEQLIGCLLFLQDGGEDLRVVRQAQKIGPVAQSSVDGDLVVLDLLRGGDQGNVANAILFRVLDAILGFGNQIALQVSVSLSPEAFRSNASTLSTCPSVCCR
jgi:hypothetical protein